MDQPLFPDLPEDLADESVTDEALASLLKEHEVAAELLDAGDEEFTKGISPEHELAELERSVKQIAQIKAEQKRRLGEEEDYLARKAELKAEREALLAAETEGGDEGGGGDGDEGDGDEGDGGEEGTESPAAEEESEALAAEEEGGTEEAEAEGEEPVVAEAEKPAESPAAAETKPAKRSFRRPPSPALHRMGNVQEAAALIAAAGQVGIRGGQVLDRMSLVDAYKKVAQSVGTPSHHANGIEQRFLVASANFPFPEERKLLAGEPESNARKIRAAIPNQIPGLLGLLASGGLCAPLENIYTLVNLATQARPVRAALPSFFADRGGVNVPESPTIGDIVSAISVITEAEDALGGTNATKSCQDLDCVDYVETAVTVLSHCREYGNLNARAWPERIAHENDITMAAWARTADAYLLDRIKAQSIAVTQAPYGSVMNMFASLVFAINVAQAGIKRRLRMDDNARFHVILPAFIGEMLAVDSALKHLDSADQSKAALTAKLGQYNVSVSYALDDVAGADAFGATQAAGALEGFPFHIQYPLYAEGTFIHLDSGTLELGLVRDSTLNSTNDFQIFGESFENVARIGPAQSAFWITQDLCPNGVYPALGTAPTCS